MSDDRVIPGDWFDDHVPPNVVIGDGAWIISSHVFLHCRSRADPAIVIGPSTGVYEGSSFVVGPSGQVTLGSFCMLVATIISTNTSVTIGDHGLLAFGTVIADTAFAPADLNSRDGSGRPVVIGDNVWVGARSVVLGGAEIGDDAVIGAGSVVSGRVAAGTVAAGNPARVVGRVR